MRSCVVRLDIRSSAPLDGAQEALFFRVLAAAFAGKRRQLKNTLAPVLGPRVDDRLRSAGIAPEASDPGYGLIAFAPKPGGGLSHARASIETPYGRAVIRWRLDEYASLRVSLDVPPGAQGRFDVPRGWELADSGGQGLLALASGAHDLVLSRTP